jgi:hypothetical protein
MRRAVPPLPNTPSWRGAQLQHRDNFNFYITNTDRIDPSFDNNTMTVLTAAKMPRRTDRQSDSTHVVSCSRFARVKTHDRHPSRILKADRT